MLRAYWLDPRDKPALLVAIMRELAGTKTSIVLEGDVPLSEIPGAVEGLPDFPAVHRQAPEAKNVVVLPLISESIRPITAALLAAGGVTRAVYAIQIVKDSEVEFMAADSFHRECVSVGPAVNQAKLEELVKDGVLRSYKPA